MEGIGVEAKGGGEEGEKWWKWEERRGLKAAVVVQRKRQKSQRHQGWRQRTPPASLSPGLPIKIPVRIRRKSSSLGIVQGKNNSLLILFDCLWSQSVI
jgi:hypothetical protein